MKRFICFIILLFVFAPCVCAADDEGLYDDFDFSALYEAMGKDVGEKLGKVEELNTESISPKGLISYALSALSLLIKPFLGGLSLILAFLCVGALVRRVCSGFTLCSTDRCVSYAVILALSLIVYKEISDDLRAVSELLSSVQGYYASAVPIMTGMYALGGNTALAAANGACSTVVLSVATLICKSIVLPASKLCFALSLASFDTVKLQAVSKAIAGFASKLLAITMGLVCSGMLLTTKLAASADGVGIRVLKFAASSFVPIIGGAMSEATATLTESVRVIRSGFGIFGIAAIVYMILPVILRVWAGKLSLSVAAGFADMLDSKKESAFLKELSSVYMISLSAVIGICLCLILALTIFVNTAAVR